MKTKIRRRSIGGVMAGLCLLALGCSDGVLPDGGGGPEVPPALSMPLCKSFTASPTEIDRGGSVTLSWEVELADKVEIAAGGDNPFRYETTDQFTGTTPVDNIQQTTVFILTGFNSSIPEAPEEAEEGTAPPSGMVLKAEGEEGEGEGGEEGETPPAPQICRKNVEVRVRAAAEVVTIEQFYPERDEIRPGDETKLHWTVLPDEAQVSITGSSGDQPVLVSCDEESTEEALTDGEVPEVYPASGCASVAPMEQTDYTLTATLGEDTETKTITIRIIEEEPEEPEEPETPVLQVNCSDIQVAAPLSPVFSGEEVKLSWQISGVTAANITSVQIVVEKSGEVLQTVETEGESGSYANVAAKSGLAVKFVAADGSVPCSKTPWTVASLGDPSGVKAVKVVDDPADPEGAAYVGHERDGFNSGKILVTRYPDVNNPLEINFFDPLKGFDEITGALSTNFMSEDIRTFPVHAIAKGSDGTLFVATTGVILYKKPEGEWKALTSMLLWGDSGQEGTHASCFGKEQSGRTGRTHDDIVGMSQFCDLEVAGDKLYAATDKGLFWLENVNSFIDGEGTWQGLESNPTDTHVVNDVFVTGSDYYAAGAMGVLKNNSEVILSDVYANSVAVASNMVVVGAAEGVYVNGVKKQDGNIYSVAIDPYDSQTIYAAGASGFYVSRDGGESFTQVAIEGLTGELRSVAVLYSTDPREEEAKYYIYLAGDNGVRQANLTDVVMGGGSESAVPAEPAKTDEGTDESEETPDEGGIQLMEAIVRQP